MYVTYDTPSPGGSDSTVQRIEAVCTWAEGKSSRKDIADGVHTNMPKIRFGHTEPEVDDWRLSIAKAHEDPNETDPDEADAAFRGECDEYARFMDRSLDMLGLTGSVPYNTYASTDANVTTYESKTHTDGHEYWLKFDFDSDGTIDNNFEGSLRVNINPAMSVYHYYAVVPTLNATSELGLLRQIGPDSYGADQRWIRADPADTNDFWLSWPPGDPQLTGTEPYPN